jgi:dTMP kinase
MRLIIVDGLDAVGKDTHGKYIATYYKQKGEQIILRSHPATDNFFGKKAKQSLFQTGKIGKLKASVFYMFDVLRSIRIYYHPKKKGTLVMVRYLMGTAYLPKRIVKYGYTFFEHFVPTSKYMFFLDAPTEELIKRVKKRKDIEIFETPEELEHVRNKALMLTEHWHIIDTSGTITETQKKIQILLEQLDKTS